LGLEIDDYYPFGLTFNSYTSGTENLYKYAGNEEQKEWSVYDFNARIYDPALGRFNSLDPLSDERDWLTPYNYVQNNPLMRIDPSGMLDDWVEREDGTVEWDDNVTSADDADLQEGETYLGKNVIVATHNRDEDGGEEINTATFELYLESNKEGPSATVDGNTVPAKYEGSNFSTLAEGLYAADFAPRTKYPNEQAVFIQKLDKSSIELPNTDGGTMSGIFLHKGNFNAKTLISYGSNGTPSGPQYSEGCQTTGCGTGSQTGHTNFMNAVGNNFSGTYYLRSSNKFVGPRKANGAFR